MDEWKKTSLGELVDIGSSKRIFYKEYVTEGIPFYRSKEVIEKHNRHAVSTELQISNERYNDIKEKFGVPIEGDMLLTSVGTLGIPYIVQKDEIFYFKDGNLTWFRKFNTNFWNQFLYYWIISPIGKNELDMVTIGSTQSALTIKGLRSMTINSPPLPEQKAIASVLSSLDDKIDLLHRQSKTLEAMAETLFRQWFVEEAQENWEKVKLGDFIKVKHGYAFRGESIVTEKNNQVLVTPGNFKIGGGFKFGKMKYFIGSNYPNDYIFSSDDLIVTMTDLSKEGDTLGYPALIPEHNQDEVLYLHNQRVGKVEFKEDISKYFVHYLMKTDDYQWFIVSGASGTSVRHTSPTSICDYSFQVPPMRRIKEFDAIVNELTSKVRRNQNQIQTLEKLRDTMLPKLMRGEVRVKYDEN